MSNLILLLLCIHAARSEAVVAVQPTYAAVTVEPTVYSAPVIQTAPVVHAQSPYIGSYAVHAPAVSHTYHQTQTHPVAYVKPVNYFSLILTAD